MFCFHISSLAYIYWIEKFCCSIFTLVITKLRLLLLSIVYVSPSKRREQPFWINWPMLSGFNFKLGTNRTFWMNLVFLFVFIIIVPFSLTSANAFCLVWLVIWLKYQCLENTSNKWLRLLQQLSMNHLSFFTSNIGWK